MVQGLELFKEYFKNHNDKYVLIGGTACYIKSDEVGLDFRATKDLDIVLIVEALDIEFANTFWAFITKGGYVIKEQSKRKELYRFQKPQHEDFPYMIELFSRVPDGLELNNRGTFTPVPIDDEVSSLSAILLDDVYYNLLIDGKEIVDEYSVLKSEYLILFKIRAWIDYTKRKDNGESGISSQIKKHKNDILRLSQLIQPGIVHIPVSIYEDLIMFIETMHHEDIQMKHLGLKGTNKDSVLNRISTAFTIKQDETVLSNHETNVIKNI